MDLVYSVDQENVIQKICRFFCFQQEVCPCPAVNCQEEPPYFIDRLKPWEHYNISPGFDHTFDFLFRGRVVHSCVMNRIDPDQQLSLSDSCTYSPDIFNGMLVDQRILPLLPEGFPYIFHVHENAVDTVLFGNACHVRNVSNIHQVKRHLCFLRL